MEPKENYELSHAYRDPLCPDSEMILDVAIGKGNIALLNDVIIFKNSGYLVGLPLVDMEVDSGTLRRFTWYSLGHTNIELRREIRRGIPGEPRRMHHPGVVELIQNRPMREVYQQKSREDLSEKIRVVTNEIIQLEPIIL